MVPNPNRMRRRILIALGVIAVVCCLGGAVGGLLVLNNSRSELPQVRATVVNYLNLVEEGNLADAYAQLCANVRSHISPESFAAATHPLRSYEITGVSVNNTNGQLRGLVSTRLLLADGTTSVQSFPLIKEAGAWRICDSE